MPAFGTTLAAEQARQEAAAKEVAAMPGIFVVGFVGKAIGFIIVVFILAVIGLFTLVKKAL
jgi:hypothetical protein